MVEHVVFHGRRDDQRGYGGKVHGAQQIVRQPYRQSGDDVGRRRSDDQSVDVSGQGDVSG